MDFAFLESKLGEGERKIRSSLKEKMIDIAHRYRAELIKHRTYSTGPNPITPDNTIAGNDMKFLLLL